MDNNAIKTDNIPIKIVWKGEGVKFELSSKDTVEKVIKDFVTKNAPNLVEEVAYFQLRRLTDGLHPLDSTLSIERNGIVADDVLLLTKALIHHQTLHDKIAASLLLVYTVVFFLTALVALMSVWPSTPDQMVLNSNRTLTITILVISYKVSPELLLLSAMILSGMLGACVYSLYAASLHLGSYQDFDYSWTAWYLTRPWIGAGLAFTLYLLVRSGILTTSLNNLNLLGLAGISVIAGLYTEQVMHKLNALVDTLFGSGPENSSGANPKTGNNSKKGENPSH